jgi:methionine-rich copper-binding protein CopC
MKTSIPRPSFLVPALLAGVLLCMPRAAMAHAYPSAETPPAGSTVKSSPAEVTIRYNAAIEDAFAKLEVLDAHGHSQNVSRPRVAPDHRTLSVKVRRLVAGQYTVKWQVVAEDGHRTHGSYTFRVVADP